MRLYYKGEKVKNPFIRSSNQRQEYFYQPNAYYRGHLIWEKDVPVQLSPNLLQWNHDEYGSSHAKTITIESGNAPFTINPDTSANFTVILNNNKTITCYPNKENPSFIDGILGDFLIYDDGDFGIFQLIQHLIPVTLSASSTTLTVDYKKQTAQFTISSNVSWVITGDQSWCTLDKNSGTGDETVTVSFSAHLDFTLSPRDATLTITTTMGYPVTTVTVLISQEPLLIGGEFVVARTSNIMYTDNSGSTWV
jgi:hypothetical protein